MSGDGTSRGEASLVEELVRLVLSCGCGQAEEGVVRGVLEAVYRELGGLEVGIPKGTILARRRRDAEICQRYRSGEPAGSLARAYGLSVRQIRRIVRQAEQAEPEGGAR